MFKRLVPHLSDEYRVVAPDYFGFGSSDPFPEGLTIPELGEAMVELIAELNAESAHVFGFHTGNKVGAAMGARTPDWVDKLILCGMPHSIIPDEGTRDRMIRTHVEESLRTFEPTDDGGHLLKKWGYLQGQIANAWWDSRALAGNVTPATVDRLADQVLDKLQYRGSLEAIYGANFDYDWTADLERVQPETLILELADADEVEDIGLQGEQLTDIVPHSTRIAIEDADDGIFYDSPETVAANVKEFLDG